MKHIQIDPTNILDIYMNYYKDISGGIDGYYEKTILEANLYEIIKVQLIINWTLFLLWTLYDIWNHLLFSVIPIFSDFYYLPYKYLFFVKII